MPHDRTQLRLEFITQRPVRGRSLRVNGGARRPRASGLPYLRVDDDLPASAEVQLGTDLVATRQLPTDIEQHDVTLPGLSCASRAGMPMDACSLIVPSVLLRGAMQLGATRLGRADGESECRFSELFSTVKYKAVTLCPGGMARTQAFVHRHTAGSCRG